MEMYKICPDCFADAMQQGVCRNCGYSQNVVRAANALPVYTVLKNRYLIGRILGKGGFGITYKAYDLERGDICAVKEYMPKFLDIRRETDGRVVLARASEERKYSHGKIRFQEEQQVLERIYGYPNVSKIRDQFSLNNTSYYSMDYIDGINLKRIVSGTGRRFPEREAVEVIAKIGRTLQLIYDREGLIHRDISPENILADSYGNYTLIDFGSAKEIIEGEDNEFSVVLKPGFAPPEQYSDRMPQGSYTDVYALAGTFYYMVSGQMLPTAIERLNRPDSYVPLERLGLSVHTGVSKAVDRALEINYKRRTQTVLQFVQQLEQGLQNGQGQNGGGGRSPGGEWNPGGGGAPGPRGAEGYVEVVNGREKGRRWVLPGGGKVQAAGRDPNRCHIVVPYAEVSRLHFEICYDVGTGLFRGRDCSRNGLFVDSEFYLQEEFQVEPGCIIQFPQTECVLYLGVAHGKK